MMNAEEVEFWDDYYSLVQVMNYVYKENINYNDNSLDGFKNHLKHIKIYG